MLASEMLLNQMLTWSEKEFVSLSLPSLRVDNFSKVDDGRYVATAHLLSSFIGYDSDGKQVCHHDYTHKTIMFYFNPLINSFPDETSCVTPILFLGDISSDDVW